MTETSESRKCVRSCALGPDRLEETCMSNGQVSRRPALNTSDYRDRILGKKSQSRSTDNLSAGQHLANFWLAHLSLSLSLSNLSNYHGTSFPRQHWETRVSSAHQVLRRRVSRLLLSGIFRGSFSFSLSLYCHCARRKPKIKEEEKEERLPSPCKHTRVSYTLWWTQRYGPCFQVSD